MPDFENDGRWAYKGEKVTFLGVNGYDSERERALKVFEIGTEYEVESVRVESFSSSYRFKGVEGAWNTVMFSDPERLATKHYPKVRGWAVKYEKRGILIKTVADTRRAAIVNWLATDGGWLVLNSHTDEDIERMWDRRAKSVSVVEVEIQEKS